jgi:alpha-glucosidase
VPIPWEPDPPGFGFTAGEPWLPIPESWSALSVETQRSDESSTLALYRRLLRLRRGFEGAPFAWRDSPPGTLAFERAAVVCCLNVDGDALPLPRGELLATSRPGLRDELPPNAAAWVGGAGRGGSSD